MPNTLFASVSAIFLCLPYNATPNLICYVNQRIHRVD
ncbi:hypothetical protein BFJ69_g18692 [Fusarium oxysporum]|uniref:Uncharacterized protein n=2 Tax=Fusarium oxysporum TaxID=5507 RepID=A0A420M4N8_FUSOX|nr:hypothetical protein BFJ65_g18536 [Fusarium oxysporum f. sp. cepae]RKK26705.1 hypothetical protein BFJ67_g16516 [Fusarium oxysporum f. sp. cepae]RKK34964.1 hypothetical protein BFJ69_g18692 [Fusarium oxysporum]